MAIQSNQKHFVSSAIVSPIPNWRKINLSSRFLFDRLAVASLVVLDASCIAFSMAMAYYLRFEQMDYNSAVSRAFYLQLAVVSIPLWLLIFTSYRLYHLDHLFGGMREYANVVNACTAGLVALVLYSFLNRYIEYDISRGWLAMVWGFSVVSVVLARFGYRRLIYYLRGRGLFVRRVLVVGANEEGQAVVNQLSASPTAGVEVVGCVEPSLYRDEVTGKFHGLDRLIRTLQVEELIVIPTALEREELLDIYRHWGTNGRVRVSLSSGLYELFTTGAHVREVGFVPLVSLNRTRITGLDAVMKTVLDYVGASLSILMLSPVYLGIALATWLDSGRPIIHRRRVVGLHGKQFDAYKFRTMISNADTYLEEHPELQEEWERTGKLQHDPRITRLGYFLRRYSLDELPQLFNVLKGQMSLVGPRMIVPAELKHFRQWQHNLSTVKPGLAGLWQVSGRSDLSYEERVRLDMQYIRNYTIWQDLKLVFNTFLTVLRGRGAY